MLKVFYFLGYQVKDETGKTNRIMRIFDGLLFTAYMYISFKNLLGSVPSLSMIILNTITMGRLLLKNHFEQSAILRECRKVNKGSDYTEFTLMHLLKMIIEALFLILALIFIGANYFSGEEISVLVKVFAGIVLVLTWIDNMLTTFERVYDASPRPLLYYHNI